MRALRENLPANVRLVDPEEEISSYSLMDIAAVGLVWVSTVALEMACKGKAVVLAAGQLVAGTPFVTQAADPDRYEETLAPLRDLGARRRVGRRPAPRAALRLRSVLPRRHPLPARPHADRARLRARLPLPRGLEPGRDAGLDRCARILLEGEPLRAAGRRRAHARARRSSTRSSRTSASAHGRAAFAEELIADIALLEAWANAFDGRDDVTLLIHTSEAETRTARRRRDRGDLDREDGPDLVAMQADAATLASVDAIFSRVVRDELDASAPRYDDGRCTSWRGRDERPGRLGRHRLLQLRPHPARRRRERARAVALRLRARRSSTTVDGRLARRRAVARHRSAGHGDRAGELRPAGDPAQPRDRRRARAVVVSPTPTTRSRPTSSRSAPRPWRPTRHRPRLPASSRTSASPTSSTSTWTTASTAQALQPPAQRDDVPPRGVGGGRRLQPQRPRLRGLGPVARHRGGRLRRPPRARGALVLPQARRRRVRGVQGRRPGAEGEVVSIAAGPVRRRDRRVGARRARRRPGRALAAEQLRRRARRADPPRPLRWRATGRARGLVRRRGRPRGPVARPPARRGAFDVSTASATRACRRAGSRWRADAPRTRGSRRSRSSGRTPPTPSASRRSPRRSRTSRCTRCRGDTTLDATRTAAGVGVPVCEVAVLVSEAQAADALRRAGARRARGDAGRLRGILRRDRVLAATTRASSAPPRSNAPLEGPGLEDAVESRSSRSPTS